MHQSSGVSPVNSLFPDFAKAMGLPPKYGDHNATDFVPPDVGDKTFVEAFFKLLDGQAGGRNYWWPDNGYGTALSNQHGTKKRLLRASLCIKQSIYQDRLGTSIGKVEGERAFSAGLNRVLWDRTMFIEHVNESTCGRPTVFIPYANTAFCPLLAYANNDHFAKTGSGQTQGRLKKRTTVFSGSEGWAPAGCRSAIPAISLLHGAKNASF
eukprot:COSAG06_NODE_980_length_11224_cov_324.998382_5_plen_210_part_00